MDPRWWIAILAFGSFGMGWLLQGRGGSSLDDNGGFRMVIGVFLMTTGLVIGMGGVAMALEAAWHPGLYNTLPGP